MAGFLFPNLSRKYYHFKTTIYRINSLFHACFYIRRFLFFYCSLLLSFQSDFSLTTGFWFDQVFLHSLFWFPEALSCFLRVPAPRMISSFRERFPVIYLELIPVFTERIYFHFNSDSCGSTASLLLLFIMLLLQAAFFAIIYRIRLLLSTTYSKHCPLDTLSKILMTINCSCFFLKSQTSDKNAPHLDPPRLCFHDRYPHPASF